MNDRRPLIAALLLELSAIGLNSYAVPGAKALWFFVALGIYWMIARGARPALLLQLTAATVGTLIFAIGLHPLALVYGLEVALLAVVWRNRMSTAGTRPDTSHP